MNITHLTYDYDVFYINKGKNLDNILDMEYEVLASTIDGISYVEINITYIDRNGYIKHIKSNSENIKFTKRNESSRLCVAKEEQ